MRMEKLNTRNGIVEVPIFDDDEIETNEYIEDLEDTKELTDILKDIGVEDVK